MKIKALIDFRDRENDLKLRKAGTTFEAPEERAQHLITIGFAEAVKGGDPKKSPEKTPG